MRKIAFTIATASVAILLVSQSAGAQPPSPPANVIAETASWESLMDRAERHYLLMGPREARDLFLDVQRRAGQLPADDLRRARLSLFLGSVYQNLGDRARAVMLLEDSRRIWEAAGIEDIRYLKTLNLLASVLVELDRLGEARRTLEHALSAGRNVLGPRHGIIGTLLTTSGGLHLREGKIVEAQQALAGAVDLLRATASPSGAGNGPPRSWQCAPAAGPDGPRAPLSHGSGSG